MKTHYSLAFLFSIALLATGCAHHQAAKGSTQKPQANVIELPQQKLTFQPTRDDITVGSVVFWLHIADLGRAINLEAIRVNGVKPETPAHYLKQVGKNQFELPAMKIDYSTNELGGPLYLTLKAWFNEVTNQYDSYYYTNALDRYALLTYCTTENEDPSKVNARMGANRAATLREFKETLAQPFVIKLNQLPLRAEHGQYPMLNPLPPRNPLSAAQLKDVEQTIRNRGEQFIRGISVQDSQHAIVTVGDGTFLRSTREYKVARDVGTWRVESVKTLKESGW